MLFYSWIVLAYFKPLYPFSNYVLQFNLRIASYVSAGLCSVKANDLTLHENFMCVLEFALFINIQSQWRVWCLINVSMFFSSFTHPVLINNHSTETSGRADNWKTMFFWLQILVKPSFKHASQWKRDGLHGPHYRKHPEEAPAAETKIM